MSVFRNPYGSKSESAVISHLNNKLEFFTVIEKHPDFYILKSNREYYKSAIPHDLKVFDLIAARVEKRNPLKLNLTDLSGFSNAKQLSKEIALKFSLDDSIYIPLIYTLLLQKQLITLNTTQELATRLKLLNYSSETLLRNHYNLDFNLRGTERNDNFIPQSVYFDLLINKLIADTQNKYLPMLNQTDSNPEVLQRIISIYKGNEAFTEKGTVFDDKYINEINGHFTKYKNLMKSYSQHITPVIFGMQTEKKNFIVILFISGGFPTFTYTLLIDENRKFVKYVLSGGQTNKLYLLPDQYLKIGQFCATVQNPQLKDIQISMLDNLNGYVSEMFGFDMSLFDELVSSATSDIELPRISDIPALKENQSRMSMKFASVYTETLDAIIKSEVI